MQTAVIIGSTSGIGRAVAHSLSMKGYRVVVTGRRKDSLDSFKADHDNCLSYVMDVTKDESVQVLDSILEDTGMPDLFLYVSGVGYQNRALDLDKEIVTVRTNCEGMVRLVAHFMSHVRTAAEKGIVTESCPVHIGVVSSVAGTAGLGTAPSYSATKKMQSTYVSALCQLSRMEHLPVVFSDIRPGFVATDILNPDKHYPMMISPQKAADHIVRGLEKRERVIIFDWRFKLIVLLWRMIPRPIWERLTIVRN